MDAGSPLQQVLEAVASLGPRRTGSDVERRAAKALTAAIGREARPRVESIYVHPHWPTAYFLHCVLAAAGSLLATASAPAGFALVLVAATSLHLDLTGRGYLLRRLFFRRASQNIVAPPLAEDGERPRVLLCAHYDSGPTGAAYNPAAVRAFALLQRLWPLPISPTSLVFWSMALLLPPLGLRLGGIEEGWVALLQLPQTMLLVVAAFLLAEIALSPTSPGANAGAAGAAAALEAFRRLDAEPLAALDVHLALTGGGTATQQGLRELLRRHRGELDRHSTFLLEIDSPGRGQPRFVLRQIPALTEKLDPTLIELCEALSEPGSGRAALPVGPAGAAAMAAGRGYRSIALTAREGTELVPEGHHTPADTLEGVSVASVEAVVELAVELVRLLDRDLERRARPSPSPP